MALARIGHRAGHQASFTSADVPDEHYIGAESTLEPVVAEARTIELEVVVRDKYNNPVSTVPVEAEPESGEIRGNNRQLTTSDGTVSFRYRAPEIVSPVEDVSSSNVDVDINVPSIAGDRGELTYEVEVQNVHN
jgi:hypothetical protein